MLVINIPSLKKSKKVTYSVNLISNMIQITIFEFSKPPKKIVFFQAESIGTSLRSVALMVSEIWGSKVDTPFKKPYKRAIFCYSKVLQNFINNF